MFKLDSKFINKILHYVVYEKHIPDLIFIYLLCLYIVLHSLLFIFHSSVYMRYLNDHCADIKTVDLI